MLPYSYIGGGTFTNPATVVPVNIVLSDSPDWFFVKNLTNWGKASTADAAIYSEWFSGMAAASYLGIGQVSSGTPSSVTMYSTQGTSGGFTFIDSTNPPTYAVLAATAINNTTFVVSMASTAGLFVGDIVRLTGTTGMLQASGIVGQITAISANTSITLGYVATAISAGLTFAASATAANVTKIYPGKFYPEKRQIMYITQATQAKVYFARPNDFTPGELVDFTIPTAFGMTQLNFLTGVAGGAARVLVVTNTASESSITINVNTTGYTAFVYPATGVFASGGSPATCYPAGSGIVPLSSNTALPQPPPGTNLLDAFDNRNQFYMNIGTTAAGAASTTLQWAAFKFDFNNLSNA